MFLLIHEVSSPTPSTVHTRYIPSAHRSNNMHEHELDRSRIQTCGRLVMLHIGDVSNLRG